MGPEESRAAAFLGAEGGWGEGRLSDWCASLLQTSSCHRKIDELFSGKLYLIGIAAIVVAVIMVSGTAPHSGAGGWGKATRAALLQLSSGCGLACSTSSLHLSYFGIW